MLAAVIPAADNIAAEHLGLIDGLALGPARTAAQIAVGPGVGKESQQRQVEEQALAEPAQDQP